MIAGTGWWEALIESTIFSIKFAVVLGTYYFSRYYVVIQRSSKMPPKRERYMMYAQCIVVAVISAFFISAAIIVNAGDGSKGTETALFYWKVICIVLGISALSGAEQGYSVSDEKASKMKTIYLREKYRGGDYPLQQC